LSRFVQKCGERWDDGAWKQIAEVKYEAMNSKKGEAEAENVDKMHEIGNSKAQAIRYWRGGLRGDDPPSQRADIMY
jgi:hypothetical protein